MTLDNFNLSHLPIYIMGEDKVSRYSLYMATLGNRPDLFPGYTIDEATRTQTVVVNPNDTQTLHFTNTPSTTLVIEKYIEGTTTPLKIDCTVVSWAKGGSQFVNQADVGGVYNGQWIMATTRWVTKVYAPPTTLPRTGY